MRFKHQDNSYAEAINYLMKNPEKAYKAWVVPSVQKGGSLFMYCSPTGLQTLGCGCLTQVRLLVGIQPVTGFPDSEALTQEVRNDERLQTSPDDWGDKSESDPTGYPSRETLEAFAEWQTRFDELALPMKETKNEKDPNSGVHNV